MPDLNAYSEQGLSIKILKNDIPDTDGVRLLDFGICVGDIYEATVYFSSKSGKHCSARILEDEGEGGIVLFAPEFELVED